MPVPSAVISETMVSLESHAVEAHALDIQDLAAQGQYRLVVAVASLLGAAAGRIALDDEELAFGRIALLAVRQLAGQRGAVEHALAARQFAGLARRLARGGGFHHLADDGLGFARMLLEPAAEMLQHRAFDDGTHLGGDKFVLGL